MGTTFLFYLLLILLFMNTFVHAAHYNEMRLHNEITSENREAKDTTPNEIIVLSDFQERIIKNYKCFSYFPGCHLLREAGLFLSVYFW